MPLNQTNKLVWIANTIHSARKITFEELNSRWIEDDDIRTWSKSMDQLINE